MSVAVQHQHPSQIIIFELDSELFALDIAFVHEILPMLPIRKLPRVEAYVEGLIDMRGHVIPLLNLRKMFSLRHNAVEGSIVIVRSGNRSCGILVDQVSEVVTGNGSFRELPKAGLRVATRYVESVLLHDEKIVILLNPSEITSHLTGKEA